MISPSIRSRAPIASSPIVHRVMRANVGGTTNPEKLLRSALHRAGLRFRKNSKPLKTFRCQADIVFRRQRVCVFVDGCYWHGCPIHFKCPKTNSEWWREKISDNVERDLRQTRLLRQEHWCVVRVWEHNVQNNIEECVSIIKEAVGYKFDRPSGPVAQDAT
jgi:DNA mismatch endonuclease (patch repair protein)